MKIETLLKSIEERSKADNVILGCAKFIYEETRDLTSQGRSYMFEALTELFPENKERYRGRLH